MKTYFFKHLNPEQINALCQRKTVRFEDIFPKVKEILKSVKKSGDRAVRSYTKKFDGVTPVSFAVTREEIESACRKIPEEVQKAFEIAAANIEKFHSPHLAKRYTVETMPGVTCFTEVRPIEKVGLYTPGGSAPLASTVLMLAIPARLAGCQEIVLCTPPNIDGNVPPIILFAANLCGVKRVFKIGGAQAIAALGYGTESVPKVYKIFGPGNPYVTAAKMLISIDPAGAAIDMPAGPTEVLVIADETARNDFVASDLLSQAEHGADSQAILVCFDEKKAREILMEAQKQLEVLPRRKIAQKALENSFALIVDSLDEAFGFANAYAPEHLILNIDNPERHIKSVTNAGSVFLGPYSCEAAGDYASGTNHALPTYGYARVYGGTSLNSFQKLITFQRLSAAGARNLGPVVAKLAEQESLEGHRRAMEIRYNDDKSDRN